MKTANRQSGRTLVEMAIVITTIVLLGGLGLPAIRSFIGSFESGAGAKAVISAALASARAIAAKEQRYAGIRFQKAYNPDFPLDPLKAGQYMVFIINDPNIGAYFFRAVEGLEPMKLPDTVGVMDYELIKQKIISDPTWEPSSNHPVDVTDLTTFSIIFSPSGKLVRHDVRVRNRDGERDTSTTVSYDDVFNKKAQVDTGIGMFYQDDYANLGLGLEESRRDFIIYDRREFKSAYDKGRAYSDYLSKFIPNEVIQINPYTGTMVEK
jgi:hypothetical protein